MKAVIFMFLYGCSNNTSLSSTVESLGTSFTPISLLKTRQPYGKEATLFLRNQIEDKDIEIEYDINITDKYDRKLIHVRFNSQTVRSFSLK
ncbi:thermonuclease family protein [Bacillus sp. AFS040349]|uniref:thermonuclease family protein n=1 Tax=Bacillus sp. AFS040349 TaxID=2033502 RepID=UPI000BFD0BF8|nr:hypothetical protein COD11_22485 [Bacillus sp. AFS040349]